MAHSPQVGCREYKSKKSNGGVTMDTNTKQHGVLASWSERGYGFIVGDGRQSYFLHISEIIEGPPIPRIGSNVEFIPAPPHNGGRLPSAVNVRILSAEVRR
jgi:cold shock CspA family protein